MSDYDFVTIEWMDDYIDYILHRVLIYTLPPKHMQIVKRYKEYKKKHPAIKKVEFKKLMNILVKDLDLGD